MANRFSYKEICPDCEKEGLVDQETNATPTLGFDLDTQQISCEKGHVFEVLPSETVAKTDDGALRNSETGVAETRDGSLQLSATLSADPGLADEVVEGSSGDPGCH